jgi:hypothetical protein
MREQDVVDASWGGTQHPAAATGDRIRWYVNRLSCMSRAEIGHRVHRAVANQAERWQLAGSVSVPRPDLARTPLHWVQVAARVDTARYMAAADRIAAGRFDLFALRDVELGSPPRWNRDPSSGIEAPLTFGKSLDYRDPGRVGDIKYLWELNRHLHLVTLAQAYALSGEARYFAALRTHLESWIASCPFRRGPNWSSALEAAIRLINWSVAWQLLGGAHSPLFADTGGSRFRQSWLESVYRHAEFIRGHFSFHSSANNHLVGEAAGLFVAAVTWPHWPIAGEWRTEAKAILEREALLQNAPDGVNREQAVSYQQFVLDLLLQALLAGRANREEFPASFASRIEAMIEYLASIMDAGGNVPMIGDSDDALVVSLDPASPGSPYRSHLAAGALLFGRGDFKAKAGALDDKTRWLFGEGADAAFRALAADSTRLPARRTFPDGGYYILGCDFETGDEIRLVADAGPLGYLAIAAHGHADALAFTLSVGGEEFLIDPGTYAYHTHRTWREYFRGTSAHNTLRVDGKDQSQPGGNFMWLRKANAHCDLWASSDDEDVFEGTHDGYARLPDPVTHRRRITLDKRRRKVIVEDTLRMAGTHDVELYFHCSAQCLVESGPSGYALRRGSRKLVLTLPHVPGATSRIYRGSHVPICGWISKRFDQKEPAPTIAWKARLAGDTVLRSEILC